LFAGWTIFYGACRSRTLPAGVPGGRISMKSLIRGLASAARFAETTRAGAMPSMGTVIRLGAL